MVSGEAAPVTILTQGGDAEEEDKFTLDWVVASRSPVTSWVLGLRVAGTGKTKHSLQTFLNITNF